MELALNPEDACRTRRNARGSEREQADDAGAEKVCRKSR